MIELTARKQDSSLVKWTEEVPLSAETAVHTVSPPAQDNGAPTMLVARVYFVNMDGRRLRGPSLDEQFVVASNGTYVSTEQRFETFIWEGPFVDPHHGMDIDEEVAP